MTRRGRDSGLSSCLSTLAAVQFEPEAVSLLALVDSASERLELLRRRRAQPEWWPLVRT